MSDDLIAGLRRRDHAADLEALLADLDLATLQAAMGEAAK
jgi:hypothetical protein